MKKAKIIVHCLVENEGRFIWYAINSVLPYVDKMMVWDMSSIDGSEEIIKSIKSTKIEFKSVSPGTPEGLTRERQKMLDQTPEEYTWVMILDGDEIWPEKSIRAVTNFARIHPEYESIVVRTNNLVGDIYHRLPESAGKYHLVGRVGHLALRFMNLKLIKGLHVSRPHGTQGFFDKDEVLAQNRDPGKIKFFDLTYHHATHLPRSLERVGDAAVPKRLMKLKYELGETISADQIPEVFFARNKPEIVPNITAPAKTLFWLKAGLLTIPRRIKRIFSRANMATKVFFLFLASRLFFLLIAFLSPYFIKIDPGYLGSQVSRGELPLVWFWANMDGRHFIKIATEGYSGTNFAYFPLYPLLINLVTRVGLTPIISGIIVSLLAMALAVYYLLKLVDLDKHKVSKTEVLILLFLFPFSFILHSVYADALFLFLTTASFYYARKSNWFVSGLFAMFASLTRLSGLALLPALVVEWWLQKRPSRKAALAPALSFAGFAIYAFFLQMTQGNWHLFQSSMRAWKQEKMVFITRVFYRYLKIFFKVSRGLLVYWIAVLEFASFILYSALSIFVGKKVRASYGVFMIVSLSLVTFTGTFAGTPRYLVHLFPAFIGLALIMEKYSWFRFVYYPVTIILGILITAFFVQGYFVG